jgi:hypothetical protein
VGAREAAAAAGRGGGGGGGGGGAPRHVQEAHAMTAEMKGFVQHMASLLGETVGFSAPTLANDNEVVFPGHAAADARAGRHVDGRGEEVVWRQHAHHGLHDGRVTQTDRRHSPRARAAPSSPLRCGLAARRDASPSCAPPRGSVHRLRSLHATGFQRGGGGRAGKNHAPHEERRRLSRPGGLPRDSVREIA